MLRRVIWTDSMSWRMITQTSSSLARTVEIRPCGSTGIVKLPPRVKVLLLRGPHDRECPVESSGADAELDAADGLSALSDIVRRVASERS